MKADVSRGNKLAQEMDRRCWGLAGKYRSKLLRRIRTGFLPCGKKDAPDPKESSMFDRFSSFPGSWRVAVLRKQAIAIPFGNGLMGRLADLNSLMSTAPQTIQIFLPGGDPRGVRVAEITTRIIQVIEVPRSLLGEFLKMPESNQVAVYFLIGQAENGTESKVYIGQTGDLQARLAKHNKDKDFWERALVLISRTNSLTQTHTLFLEWQSLQACREVGRYADENGNSGSRPHTPAPLEAECLEIFETGRVLLSTLGYPLFDPVAKVNPAAEKDEIFHCTASGAKGRGIYSEEGFVVLKGSSGRKKNVPSLGASGVNLRSRLVESAVARIEGDRIVFEKDYAFGSPSWAAVALMGRQANGWIDWKTEDGRTLSDVKRGNE